MDEQIKKWNAIAREYDTLITRGDFFREHLLNPTVISLIPKLRGMRVLDAGCGQGYLSSFMREGGADVVGVDASETMIALAKEHYPESPSLAFHIHDLRKPFRFFNGSFDGVVANMVLMDIDPIDSAIKEMGRLTKSGGFFVFSILHPFFASGLVRKNFSELLRRQSPHYELSQYATHFTKEWRVRGVSHKTNIYHRPLEYYSLLLIASGFSITDIREPVLRKKDIEEEGALLAEIPMFLVIRAEKIPTK